MPLSSRPSLKEDSSPAPCPYVLWFDTLPNGSTATVYIYPRPDKACVILHRNDRVHSAYTFPTCETAIRWGWTLHQLVLDRTVDRLDS